MMNDADIEMAQAASAANHAASTRGREPFDVAKHGEILAAAVRSAVTHFNPIFETITVIADDEGFAHDDAATDFAFGVAQKHKEKLEAEEREAMR